MEQEFIKYLTEMSGHILTVVGLAALPLITSFIFRAGKLRNITPENMEEKVGDLCAETIKLSIDDQIRALLKAYCQLDPNLIMPTFRKLRQVFDQVHQDCICH